jgi:hypothetical protein
MRNSIITATILFAASSVAGAATITNPIKNGTFGTNAAPSLADWTTGPTNSTAVNLRAANDDIDSKLQGTDDKADRFDNFFTSGSFAVLGDDAGLIGGPPDQGTFALSQQFKLPKKADGNEILNFDLTLSFRYAFDGVVDANPPVGALDDDFTVTLTRINPNNQRVLQTYNLFTSSLGIARSRQVSGDFSAQLLDLLPGATYVLSFVLHEKGAGFNSAVGIDTVKLLGDATVAAVPVPAPLLLLGSAVAGISTFARRRTAAA